MEKLSTSPHPELVSPVDRIKQHLENAVNWGPRAAVLYTVITYFVSQYSAALIILAYPIYKHWGEAQASNWLQSSPVAQFFTVALVEALVIVMLRWFLKHRHTTFRALGWNRKPRGSDLAYMFAGFGVYFVLLNFIIFPLSKSLAPRLNFNQKQDIGFTAAHGPVLILVFISLAILPPLVEETLVRGFLYTGLKRELPKLTAALITCVMFAAAHLQLGSGQPPLWTAAIDTFILSLVLVYLREKTDSLYASVGVHFLKNSLAFAAIFLFHVV